MTLTEPEVDDAPRERVRSSLVLVAFLAISASVATFGSLAALPGLRGWYSAAAKAPWSPPDWAFPLAWTILYTLMSVAAWLVWRERHTRVVTAALTLYVTQLMLACLWTPLFFALRPAIGLSAVWLALIVLLLLIATLVALIREFWDLHLPAAVALFPYLGWCVYIASLNVAVGVLA